MPVTRLTYRRCVLAFGLLLGTPACGGGRVCPSDIAFAERSMQSDMVIPAKAAIAGVLDDWHAAAARADEEAYFAAFAPNGVFLGTDATERWEVEAFRAYAHPHFERGRAWTFRAVRRSVTVDGSIAWFDEDLATEKLGPARGSGVLVRMNDGHWRIAQYNLALTIPNERFAEVHRVLESADAGTRD